MFFYSRYITFLLSAVKNKNNRDCGSEFNTNMNTSLNNFPWTKLYTKRDKGGFGVSC